jgi:PAS domain S-box-containing protein
MGSDQSIAAEDPVYLDLFDNAPVAYHELDRGGLIRRVNHAHCALLGYQAHEMLGRPVWEFIAEADRAASREAISLGLSGGEPLATAQRRFLRRDGRELWLEIHASLVRNAAGETAGIRAVLVEITGRKAADAKLQAQSERFRTIVENTDAGYFRIGTDGCYQDVNPAWLRMYGFTSREEAIGLHWSAVQVPEDAAKAEDIVAAVLRGGSIRNGEFSRLRRDGSIGYHGFSANPVLDGGRVVGIEGFLVDLSEQKEAERERRNSERRYRSLFDSMHEGVALHKLTRSGGVADNYILLEVNRRYEDVLGIKREQVVNRLATEVYGTGEPPYLKEYAAVVDSGSSFQFETYFPPMDKHFVVSAAPMGDERFATIFFDVTEQKRVQQAIRQASESVAKAESHYHLMFHSVSDAVFVHRFGADGLPGCYLEVNDNACRHLGYTREELLRLGPFDIDAPEEYSGVTVRAQRLRADGHLLWEGTHVAKDGRRIPVEVNTRLVDLDGSPAIISSVRDISARKDAEKRYRDIFDGALEGIYRISVEGRALEANPAMARMLGYDSANEVTSTVTDWTHQVWADPAERSDFMELLERQESVRGYECQFKRKDGSVIWVSLNSRRVCGADGQILYNEGFIEDITARKKAEYELRASEARFRTLTEGAPVAISMSRDGRVVFANPAYLRMFGFQGAEELDGIPTIELFAPQCREEYEQRAKRREQGLPVPGDFEATGRRADGSEFPMRLTVQAMQFVEGPALVAFITDLTGSRRAEAERMQLEQQFQQAQKLESIGRLAGGVAHDFNNLLTVINGYAGLLLPEYKKGDPSREWVEEICHAGQRAVSLTGQLLAFSRKQMVERRPVFLHSLVAENKAMLQRLIGEDIELVTQSDPSGWPVMADAGQMHQVLMNLVVNARDAMPHGGTVTIRTANVEAGAIDAAGLPGIAPGPYVSLRVSDTGVGIAKEIQQRIFDPFFTTKVEGEGTGLGLSTVYGIVRQFGGSIAVNSEPDRGTTFEIHLPRLEETAAVGARAASETVPARGTETVLVVEDQDPVRNLAVAVLKKHGYRVLDAAQGSAALLVAERHTGPIHLLLTDVVMPHMSGKELADRLKPLRPEMKVLYMSGYAADVIARRERLESDAAYLAKPFAPDVLAMKVREVLGAPPLAATILVVDDEESVRDFFAQVLVRTGYEVVAARNGAEALDKFRERRFDLVLTDLVMPEKEGIEMIGILRKERPDLKVVAVSGAFGGAFLQVAQLLGANATLLKPVSPDQLLAAVRGVLAEGAAQEVLGRSPR